MWNLVKNPVVGLSRTVLHVDYYSGETNFGRSPKSRLMSVSGMLLNVSKCTRLLERANGGHVEQEG